jgi:hypothetical protein
MGPNGLVRFVQCFKGFIMYICMHPTITVAAPSKHELSSLARNFGSWVRIPLKTWMSVCPFILFVLSCV